MDYGTIFQQIEEACADMQVPATRHAGEQVLLQFRQTSGNLAACQYILDHTSSHVVQFHMASAISTAVSREYLLYSHSDLTSLKIYLLTYLLKRPSIPTYAREQLLYAIAVLTKRGIEDYDEQEKRKVMDQMRELCGVSEWGRELAIGLGKALVDEFGMIRGSRVGVSWDYHKRTKEYFESNYLLPLFDLLLNVLHGQYQTHAQSPHYVSTTLADDARISNHTTSSSNPTNSSFNPKQDPLLLICFSLADKILSWNFERKKEGIMLAGAFAAEGEIIEEDELFESAMTPEFPASWRSYLTNPDVLKMFFALHKLVQGSEMAAHRSRQCLIQLSGLHGELFEDTEQFKAYASIIIEQLMKLMDDLALAYSLPTPIQPQTHGPTLLGVTQMIRRLLTTIPLNILCFVPEAGQFLHSVAQLSATCLREPVRSGYMVDELTWYMEAFDDLLAVWVMLVQNALELCASQPTYSRGMDYQSQSSFDTTGVLGFLAEACNHITATYIETRLEMAKYLVEEEDEDLEGFKDWETYEDQLLGISILARIVPERTIGRLYQCLHERTTYLKKFFGTGVGEENNSLDYLYETTHWLILISGFVLADSGEGEQPLVPDSMSNLSKELDQVVILTKTILSILELVSLDPSTIEASHCSPRVAETLFWFVERWGSTYLLLDEKDHSMMSQNIVSAFGRPSSFGEGKAVLDFLIDKIRINFKLWSADSEPLIQIVRTLDSFGKRSALRNGLLESDKFPSLVSYLTDNLNEFPPTTHSGMIKTITVITSGAPDGGIRRKYFELVTNTIEKRFINVLQRPDLAQVYHNGELINDVMNTLEMFDGLAMGSNMLNCILVYEFCARYFESFIKLINIYQNYSEVSLLVLQFFDSFVKYQDFGKLSSEQSQILYNAVIELFKNYFAANSGRQRIGCLEEEEDDPYADICLLLDLLSELMASEFEACGWDVSSRKQPLGDVDVASVVLYGLNLIIPLINLQMLKLPKLCKEYVKLIAHIVEFYPDKLGNLTQELLTHILGSLEYGIEKYPFISMRSITPLALFVHNEERKRNSTATVQHLHAPLDKLLNVIMDCLLFKEFNSDMLEPAAEALIALICARRNSYNGLVQTLVSQQNTREFEDRLRDAFTTLQANVPNTLPETVLSRRDVGSFRDVLYTFLMNVRGFLRIR